MMKDVELKLRDELRLKETFIVAILAENKQFEVAAGKFEEVVAECKSVIADLKEQIRILEMQLRREQVDDGVIIRGQV